MKDTPPEYTVTFKAITEVAREQKTLTADDIRERLVRIPVTLKYVGQAMRQARLRGIVRATDLHIAPNHNRGHGRPIRVWDSLICKDGVNPPGETSLMDIIKLQIRIRELEAENAQLQEELRGYREHVVAAGPSIYPRL